MELVQGLERIVWQIGLAALSLTVVIGVVGVTIIRRLECIAHLLASIDRFLSTESKLVQSVSEPKGQQIVSNIQHRKELGLDRER